ncbi:MAG: DUF3293 domain-containing protein [Nocardioidaceae bacterium]|nr:DUF3293 domain-containing protein [Nocardioidaceae bacterium]
MYDADVPPTIEPRVPYATFHAPAPRVDPDDLTSYRSQVVLDPRTLARGPESWWPDEVAAQAPAGSRSVTGPVPTELDLGVWFVSAWNPGAEPASLAANLRRHEALLTHAEQLDEHALTTVVHAPDRSWAEQAVMVRHRDDALLLAREHGAPAVVRCSDLGTVVLVPSGERLTSVSTVRLGAPPRCPLLAESRAGQLCRQYGGPFGRRAIQAAADWQIHRDLLLSTLGCEVCEDGRFTVCYPDKDHPVEGSGGAISLVDATVASRWGGPFVR